MCELLKCESLKKIRMILDFYETVKKDINDDNNGALLLKYLSEYKGNIINDYLHLLNVHLNHEKAENDQNFQIICNKICKNIQCDLKKCKSFVRNSRNREIEQNQETTIKPQLTFYVDLLDNIHCHLLHSYQTGFRIIKQNEESKQNDVDKNNDKNKENAALLYDDDKLKDLQQYLMNKRQTLQDIGGADRMKKSKFVINPTINNNVEQKDNNDEKNQDNLKGAHLNYSFGIKCYYWDYYKNNEGKDCLYNNGDKYSDWYVSKKYNNLKQEIINNKICALNVPMYNIAYQKALNFIYCDVIKEMQSENANKSWCQLGYADALYYGIDDGTPITMNHLLSIIFYTDFSNLSYNFSRSFRKIKENENNEEYKIRCSEYANWSRLIRETVELYGTEMHPMFGNKIDIFYTGISSTVLVNSFVAYFNGPTSMSPQLSVALLFAVSGCILELKMEDDAGQYLKYFNCSLLSCFASEDERLFVGGWSPLKFHSIRDVSAGKNYHIFIRAMSLFDTALNSGEITNDKDKGNNIDYRILSSLIRHHLTIEFYQNKFPLYINQLFAQFVSKKIEIKITLKYFNGCYKGFGKYLLHPSCSNLVSFSFLTQLFPECRNITIELWGGYSSISSVHLSLLLSEFVEINKHKTCNLIQISLIKCWIECGSSKIKSFMNVIESINWKVERSPYPKDNSYENIVVSKL